MKTTIKFFLENYRLTFIVSFFLLFFGIYGAKNLLREDTPNVDVGKVRITTIYPGTTAEEVEMEVTKKIEDKLQEVKGIKKIESRSQINMSIIKITIDIDNFKQNEVSDDIKTELDKINNLPIGATKPELLEINTEEFSVIEAAIIGDNTNRKRDDYVDFLEDELRDIKGIIKIEKYGYANREFSVKLNVNKMHEYHVGIDEISSALRTRNITIPAGSLKSLENQAFVRIDAKTKKIEDLENVLIRTNFEGNKIYLKDVAVVKDDMIDKETYTKINGKDATLIALKKQGGIDTIKLANKVKQKIDEIQVKMNSNFEIIYFVNAAIDVENKFNIVISNVVSGVIIVLLFLLIFLPGKIGFMATISLPITVLTTLLLMYINDMSLNTITMLGLIIALGMLVDNSVMISENFAQMISDGMSIKDAAFRSVADYWVPIMATTMTTICSFVPMFVTKGVTGLFIAGIPTVVSIALLVGLAECFFLLPCRLKKIGGSVVKQETNKKKQGNKKDWFDKFRNFFVNVTYKCVKHRYLSFLGFIFIIILSFFILGKSQFILFPPENVEQYTVRYETQVGDSLEKTAQLTERLINDLTNVIGKENIDNIVAYIGQSGTGLLDDLQQNHHTAELKIYINKQASFNLDYRKILADVRNLPKNYLTRFEILQEEAGPPVGRAVEVNIRSNDEKNLYTVVNYIFNKLSKVPGIIDLETNDYKNDDEIFIKLDYDKIARLGLNITSIGNDIRATIGGVEIANLVIDGDDFFIKLSFDDNYKQTEQDLNKIFIRDNRGNLIPLIEIATINRVAGSTMKNRYNFKKAITIRANVNEEYITGIEGNAKVIEFFNEIAKDFPDVSMVFGGEQEGTEESFESLKIAMVFALVMVFGFLVFIFNSYFSPLIIMTTIPLGLIGFAIAFYLHQRPLSFLAFIGVIGLVGVVVNSGVILITFIEMLKKENKGMEELDYILAKASGARLRAVIASALTTIAGLLPTAYGIGGRDASLIPVTLAMAWGLTSSTLLSLIWIPCCYGLINDFLNFVRKFKIFMWTNKRRKLRR